MNCILFFSKLLISTAFEKLKASLYFVYTDRNKVCKFPSLSFNGKFTALAPVPFRSLVQILLCTKEMSKVLESQTFSSFKQQKIVLNLSSASDRLEFLTLQKKMPELA